jgi:hypothetical protein
MKFLLAILLSVSTFLISCNKDPDPVIEDGVPNCVLEQIEIFKQTINPCDQNGPSVIEYKFQGSIVYAFDMGQCISDGGTSILNESCEEICLLGTIVGITDCLDEPFENAIRIRVIWQD